MEDDIYASPIWDAYRPEFKLNEKLTKIALKYNIADVERFVDFISSLNVTRLAFVEMFSEETIENQLRNARKIKNYADKLKSALLMMHGDHIVPYHSDAIQEFLATPFSANSIVRLRVIF